MKKFPKTLYVKREFDGDNSYYVPATGEYELGDVGETVTYGTYSLVETKTIDLVADIRKVR